MFHFDGFSFSKREIIVSIAIIAIMLVCGFMIHGAISDSLMLKYQKYNTALQINEDTEMFKHAMKTSIGNAFVYGELKCVDTVTFPEIDGEYSRVEKVKERYTKHTRTVTKTYTDDDGDTHTYTEEEEYWTWDEIDSWSKTSTKITFLEVEFAYGQIKLPPSGYITTIKESSKIRYVYYGAPTKCSGTLFSNLKNNTINDSKFYTDYDIESTLKILKSGSELVLFWIGWILLTGGLVFAFVYIDNRWLED
jgi:hypothetical protein